MNTHEPKFRVGDTVYAIGLGVVRITHIDPAGGKVTLRTPFGVRRIGRLEWLRKDIGTCLENKFEMRKRRAELVRVPLFPN